MARYKPIHNGLNFLPVDFDRQVLPGSVEYALCHLVGHEMDLSDFHSRDKHDTEGAPAFDPAALITSILLAYSRGIISSRKIEAACRENTLLCPGAVRGVHVMYSAKPVLPLLAAPPRMRTTQGLYLSLKKRDMRWRLP